MSASRRRALKVAAGAATVFLVLAAILVGRAATLPSRQVEVAPTTFKPAPGAIERLQQAVRIKTVSHAEPAQMDMNAFEQFHAFLATSYPRAHAVMQREFVAPCSVIYTWNGSDASARPVLLASHLDVVPVEDAQLEKWTHGPFSGDIADGYLWGRGTLDDKAGVLGLMEGAEALAAAGHVPERTLVFAFGCDEEVGGESGAKQIARRLSERKLSFEFAFDEGLAIVQGYMPGITRPVALVGIVEKGFGTYTLTVEGDGGHSSMPPPQSTIGVLAAAIAKLEATPMHAGLNPASRQMFETLGAEVGFGQRIMLANLWLFEPLFVQVLSGKPTTNAIVRTTTAVTIMRAGVQDNVLPKKAEAKVNFRLAPGDSLTDVRDHIVAAIDDPRVNVAMPPATGFATPASKVSDADTAGFRMIRDAVRATFGNEVLVSPASTTGATDVRYYEALSDNQYRFVPLLLDKEHDDTERIHGTDERVLIANYEQAVTFYTHFLHGL